MPHRDGTAVLIDEAVFEPETPRRRDCDGGEGFVDLPNVDVVARQSDAIEQFLCRHRGREADVRRVPGDRRVLDDRRQRFVAVLLRVARIGEDHRRRAVVDARRVAGRHGAVLFERLQLRHRFYARVDADGFVAVDARVRMLARNERSVRGVIERKLRRRFVFPNLARGADRGGNADLPLTRQPLDDDLVLRLARDVDRERSRRRSVRRRALAPRAAVALVRKAVLVFTRQLELDGDLAALRRHRHRKILIPKTVVDHRVDERAVAEAIAPARVAQKVRRVRHRLHAAGGDHRFALQR